MLKLRTGNRATDLADIIFPVADGHVALPDHICPPGFYFERIKNCMTLMPLYAA
jgi:hypothetical protein